MCVFYICVVDTNAASYYRIRPLKTLSQNKWHQKGKYLEDFHEILCHLMSLVLSVDGVVGGGIKASTKQLYTALLVKRLRE